MTKRFVPTIYHKLLALIVGLVVAVVAGLALYLSSQQIDAMSAALRTKAQTYGSVMASQTTSAVAFSDRETAREVLKSIDADADVASVTLYGQGGAVLYSRGSATPGLGADAAATAAQVIDADARIAAITPVVSLEGPRGVLVIELSTSSLRAARSHVHRLAFVTGAAAFLIGALAAWWIARRLARRLRAIAGVAAAVADGDLSQQPIADASGDEIGRLATAFNAMLAQLKQLIAHIQELARKEQERLEKLVAERTAQLDQRNAAMRLVLDEVDQGLMMVDLDGAMAAERSAAVERLLGPVPASGRLHDYIRAFAPASADWFELQWGMLREDILPPQLCVSQLPSRFEVRGRHLDLAYKMTEAGGVPGVLIVISDVTAQVERQRAERDERETASLVSRMLRGRAGFLAFYTEANQYVATVAEGPRNEPGYLRHVHTLKGISALEGIDSLSEACHTLETAIAEGDEIGALSASRGVAERWTMVTGKLAPLIAAATNHVELMPGDLDRLEATVRRDAPQAELLSVIESWRHERVQPRLHRFADDAHVLAARLGKEPLEVRVEVSDDLRLPGDRWGEFWSAFVHAIRNAIDHGIEPLADRLAAGKPELAVLTLRAGQCGDEILIEVEDSGKGIDWTKVALRAAERGLPHAVHGDLVEALFADGFSTRDTTTEVSGRGIGMAALRHACVATAGRITVVSQPGTGTILGFRWSRLSSAREVPQIEILQIAG